MLNKIKDLTRLIRQNPDEIAITVWDNSVIGFLLMLLYLVVVIAGGVIQAL